MQRSIVTACITFFLILLDKSFQVEKYGGQLVVIFQHQPRPFQNFNCDKFGFVFAKICSLVAVNRTGIFVELFDIVFFPVEFLQP